MIVSTMAQVIGVAGTLLTSPMATPVALPVHCQMSKAPIINVRPQTKKIQYDFDKTSAQLSTLKSSTISPYGLNPDQTTGGLRHDHPTMTTEVKYNFVHDPNTQTFCLSYNTVNVDIKLQPKIYIAKEFSRGRCAREVIKHEKKHVAVDRKVMNKYTKKMGYAIQKTINQAGVIGPFPLARQAELQKMMDNNIANAVNSVQLSLTNEMNRLQQQVDSLEEYERVSGYCKRAAKKVYDKQQKALKKK